MNGRDPVDAATRYRVCALAPGGAALLAVSPVTGRTHQIRVHASHAGAPLVGDRDYGGPSRVTLSTGRVLEPRRVALHAARVVVPAASGAPAGGRGAGAGGARRRCGPRLAGRPRRGSLRPRASSREQEPLVETLARAPALAVAPPGRLALASCVSGGRPRRAACPGRRQPPHDRREPRARRGAPARCPPELVLTSTPADPTPHGRALAVGLRPAMGPGRRLARRRQSARAAGAAGDAAGRWGGLRSSSSRGRRSSSAFASTFRSWVPPSRATAGGERRPRSRRSSARASASSSRRRREARGSSSGIAPRTGGGRCRGRRTAPGPRDASASDAARAELPTARRKAETFRRVRASNPPDNQRVPRRPKL